MALTYSTLVTAIETYLQDTDTTFSDNIDTIIKQAEDRILKAVQLPDFRKNSTGTTTSSNPYLSTPTDFLSPYSLAVDVTSAEGYRFLTYKDVSFIRAAYPSASTTAVPRFYSLFDDDTFILGPTPDNAYTVELHYFYRPTSIVTAGTSWLGDNAENCLLYGCLTEGYLFIKGEQDLQQQYEGKFKEALAELKSLGEGYSTTDSYRSGAVRSPR